MRAYVRWMLRQLYLIVFWPSLFERETEAQSGTDLNVFERLRLCLSHLVAMTPALVVAIVLATVEVAAIHLGFDIFESSGRWIHAASGVARGVAVGIAVAIASGMAFGLFSVAGGVAGGVAFGVASGIAIGGATTVGGAVGGVALAIGGMAGGVAASVVLGSVRGVAFNVRIGVTIGVVASIIFGVVVSVMEGFRAGITFGIAMPMVFWATYFRLLTYPFEAALSLISTSMARSEARRGWRLCPARWDEVIWLPLPRLSTLLVRLVREDRDAGLNAINFVAAERLLQRRAARAALLQVALDDLQAPSLQEIALKAEKLSWQTAESLDDSDQLERALAEFDRIAQQVSQYLVLQSAFRRAETLDAAIGGLEALQRNLGFSRVREAPPLLRATNTWRRLLDAERAFVRDQAAVSHEIPNPYVFGNPVGERYANVFTGRRDLVRLVEASLLGVEHPPTLLLYGARRMGKSSILKQLPRLLGPAFVSADLDCQNPAVGESPATLLRYLGRAVDDGLRRRAVVVEPLTAQQLEREPYAALDAWLDRVEQALPAGARLLVCLDEYEKLQHALDAGWGGTLLDALRHTIQHRAHITLMFVGTHTFAELGPTWTDRFISARRLRVSFLTPDEVRPLLTRPIPKFDLTYAPDALEAIIAATRGQPFLTQAVAFELVQHMNEQSRKEAGRADVEEAIRRVFESGGEYFADVWSDAGKDGHAILLAAVAGDPLPDFPNARRWLIDHDVLGENNRFLVPMMERWIREQIVDAKRPFGSRR